MDASLWNRKHRRTFGSLRWLAQSPFKLQHFLCSKGYAMDNLDEPQGIHLSLKLHPYLQSNSSFRACRIDDFSSASSACMQNTVCPTIHCCCNQALLRLSVAVVCGGWGGRGPSSPCRTRSLAAAVAAAVAVLVERSGTVNQYKSTTATHRHVPVPRFRITDASQNIAGLSGKHGGYREPEGPNPLALKENKMDNVERLVAHWTTKMPRMPEAIQRQGLPGGRIVIFAKCEEGKADKVAPSQRGRYACVC